MQYFSGYDYVLIDLANQFGHDKMTWKNRIAWADSFELTELLDIVDDAKDPILFQKAIFALMDAQLGEPSGYMVGLDATASGIQIMACLIGCPTTAANVNLGNTGYREDVYQKIADKMGGLDKADVKYPVMTTFYGSKNQPKKLFGKNTPELKAFYDTLNAELPGAMECMQDMQSCWQGDALAHQWTLPDGHVARVKVENAVDRKVEIDELNHATYTFRSYENAPAPKGLSLAANIVHSIDGYVVREMTRRASIQGFDMLSIHDSFWASPNHMNKVRQNYLDMLIEIAKTDLLGDIMREVTNDDSLEFYKLSDNLHTTMIDADYALS